MDLVQHKIVTGDDAPYVSVTANFPCHFSRRQRIRCRKCWKSSSLWASPVVLAWKKD